jgi:hypothetical protein
MRNFKWIGRIGLAWGFLLVAGDLADAQMVHPVDSDAAPGKAVYQVGYDRVWDLAIRSLKDLQFEFLVKDKSLGKIETGYVVFSRNPQFSRLSGGVRAYASTPRILLRKWIDARVRIRAQVTRLTPATTQVFLQPEIQGFASTLFDDSTVTGEWRDCRSNGKFEFEFLNELATRLQKESLPAQVPQVFLPSTTPTGIAPFEQDKGREDLSNLIIQTVPDGAEIYLNDRLVGMTPSRLSLGPGPYRVVLRKAGYKEYSRDIQVLKKSDLTVSAELQQNP